jgi:hypothetical protein
MFRMWGADVVGMTLVPECVLAREAELCYASIATVTDYDVWKDHPVCVDDIVKTMKANIENVKRIIVETIKQIDQILDVGEILISYGEFLENNHPLMPPGYCEEWWLLESGTSPPADELEAIAFALSGAYLHPKFAFMWDDVTPSQIIHLAEYICPLD